MPFLHWVSRKCPLNQSEAFHPYLRQADEEAKFLAAVAASLNWSSARYQSTLSAVDAELVGGHIIYVQPGAGNEQYQLGVITKFYEPDSNQQGYNYEVAFLRERGPRDIKLIHENYDETLSSVGKWVLVVQ